MPTRPVPINLLHLKKEKIRVFFSLSAFPVRRWRHRWKLPGGHPIQERSFIPSKACLAVAELTPCWRLGADSMLEQRRHQPSPLFSVKTAECPPPPLALTNPRLSPLTQIHHHRIHSFPTSCILIFSRTLSLSPLLCLLPLSLSLLFLTFAAHTHSSSNLGCIWLMISCRWR
jgi:hypothetical protein